MRSFGEKAALTVVGFLILGCSGSTGPVKPPTPAAILSIDTTAALPGNSVWVPLRLTRLDGDGPRLDSLGGFELLVCYDKSVLAFNGPVARGPAISSWEYFTYRTDGKVPCMSCDLGVLRLVAQRDLDNAVAPDPPQYFPEGILATLRFVVSSDRSHIGTVAEVGFCLLECRDNTIYLEGNRNSLYMPDARTGRIAFMTGYDTMACPRAYTLHPALELRGGWVRIEPPTEGLKGDIDLDGIAFEVHDAVLFSNYFHIGYAAFDPERASEQIAATDCDGDGEPLTRADLEGMIRSITAEVPIGDTLAVPYQDTLLIRPRLEGDRWILSCESTIQVDELWFKIIVPVSLEAVQYLGEPPAVVSSSAVDGRLQVACGTVNGQHIFGPELGDRFEVQGYSGYWFFMTAQASRYPGVAMTVRVVRPINGVAEFVTVGGMPR